MVYLFPQLRLKQLITASLVIWMSGIVFVFCCEMPNVKAAQNDSCPLSKIGHCQKAKTTNESASYQLEEKSFDCCAFLAYLFDKTRKPLQNQPLALITSSAKLLSPKFHYTIYTVKTAKVYRSVIHNRSGTYLKNCVFRI